MSTESGELRGEYAEPLEDLTAEILETFKEDLNPVLESITESFQSSTKIILATTEEFLPNEKAERILKFAGHRAGVIVALTLTETDLFADWEVEDQRYLLERAIGREILFEANKTYELTARKNHKVETPEFMDIRNASVNNRIRVLEGFRKRIGLRSSQEPTLPPKARA